MRLSRGVVAVNRGRTPATRDCRTGARGRCSTWNTRDRCPLPDSVRDRHRPGAPCRTASAPARPRGTRCCRSARPCRATSTVTGQPAAITLSSRSSPVSRPWGDPVCRRAAESAVDRRVITGRVLSCLPIIRQRSPGRGFDRQLPPVARSAVARSPGHLSPGHLSPVARSPGRQVRSRPVSCRPVVRSPVAQSPGPRSEVARSTVARSPVARSPRPRSPVAPSAVSRWPGHPSSTTQHRPAPPSAAPLRPAPARSGPLRPAHLHQVPRSATGTVRCRLARPPTAGRARLQRDAAAHSPHRRLSCST